jgi:hypothetical protein
LIHSLKENYVFPSFGKPALIPPSPDLELNSVELYQQFVDTEEDNNVDNGKNEYIEDENDEPAEDGDSAGFKHHKYLCSIYECVFL